MESISSGGLIHSGSEKELNKLRSKMSDYGPDMLLRVIYCILVRNVESRENWEEKFLEGCKGCK